MTRILERDESAPVSPSVDPAEIEKFRAMADDWWSPTGKFAPLHKFNPVRLGFIRDRLVTHFGRDGDARRPLDGLRILDAGCGGGLVSEPLARLGASVTGIDAGEANIKAAMLHAKSHGVGVDYRTGTVEGLIAAGETAFDVVLSLEVVEHVADAARFLADCAALLRPGGLMIMATINRTTRAFAIAVVGAEHILRWLPVGTHDWSKFVTPEEARAALVGAGLDVEPPTGVSYSPFSDRWSISQDAGVNYMLVATRPAPAAAETPESVLRFWFGEDGATLGERMKFWFGGKPEIDEEIRSRFTSLLASLSAGEAQAWAARGPRQRLAAIVVLDQFSRNIHRGTAAAFANDALARGLVADARARGEESQLSPVERMFLYLPLEHSEAATDQQTSVELFASLILLAAPEDRKQFESAHAYALRHQEVIREFGRFPHRNKALGRTSTPAEQDWLARGGGF